MLQNSNENSFFLLWYVTLQWNYLKSKDGRKRGKIKYKQQKQRLVLIDTITFFFCIAKGDDVRIQCAAWQDANDSTKKHRFLERAQLAYANKCILSTKHFALQKAHRLVWTWFSHEQVASAFFSSTISLFVEFWKHSASSSSFFKVAYTHSDFVHIFYAL